MGMGCATQGAQPSALWLPRGVGDGREVQEGGDIGGCFMWMYDRNQHKIAKQLSSNKQLQKKKIGIKKKKVQTSHQ